MDFLDQSASVTAPLLALSIVNVRSGNFTGLTFAVSQSATPSTLDPEVRSVSALQNMQPFITSGLMAAPEYRVIFCICVNVLESFLNLGNRLTG